ncbi:MAG: hypothetical protein N2Z23_10725 [Pyrinomonadaceae bacterium]|nr:hypothetical protein [Pyrinomonadaceae bacterium]MCX7640899.1 hypothetical protein [Pyrinomonadaceae bacterium]MDW8303919.1 hypothetical protein [Acidobacteriota bacterium]
MKEDDERARRLKPINLTLSQQKLVRAKKNCLMGEKMQQARC